MLKNTKPVQNQPNDLAMQNLMNFVKGQNSEFKNTISSLSTTLNSLNEKLNNVTQKVNSMNSYSKNNERPSHRISFLQVRNRNVSNSNSTDANYLNKDFIKKVVEESFNNFFDEYADKFISKIQNLSSTN